MASLSAYYTYHERDLHVGFLPHSSDKFVDLRKQFIDKWRHTEDMPIVRDILIFLVPQRNRSAYYDYRAELERRGNFMAAGFHAGNEKRRFHGTKQRCILGRNGQSKLCQNLDCNVCNIIRNAFLLERAGTSFGNVGFGQFGRFGKGLYFTSTSSKSNDYNHHSAVTVGGVVTKSMFAVKVALGKGKRLMQDSPNLFAPPTGYDSVLGEIGDALNYDECIVYDSRAALPAYLIVYSPPS
jgi:hypothetical protein